MPSFAITPLTNHTGAEVIELDFTQPIDIETRVTLNRAFAERHVLVMRDQHLKQHCGCVSSGRRLCRSHPQGRETRGPAGRAVEQVRTGH